MTRREWTRYVMTPVGYRSLADKLMGIGASIARRSTADASGRDHARGASRPRSSRQETNTRSARQQKREVPA